MILIHITYNYTISYHMILHYINTAVLGLAGRLLSTRVHLRTRRCRGSLGCGLRGDGLQYSII